MKRINRASQNRGCGKNFGRPRATCRLFRSKVLSAFVAVSSMLLTAALAFSASPPAFTSALTQAASRLSLTDVVRFVQAGESEEAIIGRIKRNGRTFDLAKDERDELKRDGVSETIIKYLMDPALPYTPPPPTPPSPPPGPSPVYPD